MKCPSFIEQLKRIDACQQNARAAVGNAVQAAESLELDETLGYFMVQADHARANERMAARLQELLAAKRAA